MNELEILDKVEEMIQANPDDRELAKGILNNLKLKDKELIKRKVFLSTIVSLLDREFLPNTFPSTQTAQWFDQHPKVKYNHVKERWKKNNYEPIWMETNLTTLYAPIKHGINKSTFIKLNP
jgi:hypothetical protein